MHFIHENASENIVCEIAAILSGGDELMKNSMTMFFKVDVNKLKSPMYIKDKPLEHFLQLSFLIQGISSNTHL